jgi:O-methyltransferase
MPNATSPSPLQARYLDLMEKALLNELNLENEMRIAFLLGQTERWDRGKLVRQLVDIRETLGEEEVQRFERMRAQGRHIDDDMQLAVFAYTMIGQKRLANLRSCAEEIFRQGIPGDFVECGVWRGGASIFLRALVEVYGEDRLTWVADSFEGLPVVSRPEDEGYDLTQELYPALAVSLAQVQANFARFDLLDERVRFLKGWFKDSLPTAPIEKISLLRLDGDLYASTIDTLDALYDKVSPGGFIVVDDYGALPPCRQAVDDFRSREGIQAPIHPIDWTGAFWIKQEEAGRPR